MTILKPHREITVNIKGVTAIEKEGLKILKELLSTADRSNCKIRFINVEKELSTIISGLTEKKTQAQKQPEF